MDRNEITGHFNGIRSVANLRMEVSSPKHFLKTWENKPDGHSQRGYTQHVQGIAL
jgi:hypothetical protein